MYNRKILLSSHLVKGVEVFDAASNPKTKRKEADKKEFTKTSYDIIYCFTIIL